ncbi:MAG TPA: secretin N-terminal domain-containing protein [Phycisphaerales bacterium]|nr:secretin N-terminal domain-containing protein [Phycisphaerales bacterium]
MKTRAETNRMFIASAAVLSVLAGTALAWQPTTSATEPQQGKDTPGEQRPVEVAKADAHTAARPAVRESADAAPKLSMPTGPAGRRAIAGEPTALGFRNVTVDQIVPFIVESTGKVVMPQQDVLNRKVTILNDRPIPREDALDLVFQALQQIGVAVVESSSVISLRDIAEITRQDVPVIGPDESTLARKDLGNFAEKIYRLRSSTAKSMGDTLKAGLPDFAKMTVDEESNQIAIMGNIALLQRIESKINGLDRPPAAALQTETFRLRFQEAATIKENIEELFGAGSTRNRGGQNQNQGGNRGGPNFQFQGRGGPEQAPTAAASEVRVTANTQQNSVTVAADPAILAQIAEQINEHWDKEMPLDVLTPKIYDLKYSDPVKVAAQLEGIFGRGTQSRTGGQQQQQNQGGGPFGFNQGGNVSPATGTGAGRLANQFSFTPMPDAGRLMVVAKTPDNIKVLDDLIEQIDQPQNAGLPSVIELKHASAEDLAEQLNALLAQDGTLASIRRAASGLTESSANSSPFATSTTTTTSNQEGFSQEQQTTGSQVISFWWQRSRTPTDRRASSNLIGQLRIVPIWRQNALMIVSPPEYKQSIIDLVAQLDKPGRQVLIAAIVAEISRDDATALGLRWSSQQITPTNPDNSFSIGNNATGTKNDFINSLFDTSVLNTEANLNLVLQALAQKTDVSILSEPKIFTSDNQEAEFFDGQDIPFVTDSQTNAQGNLVQSFDYRAVGIQLRARPRITVQGDVDLKVNLELSSIVPGQTLFGGFVVDRRETTTQLIVKNKQTIVISGILRAESSDIVRKVPLLGDIPLLGAIFRSKEKTIKNTELLVFITPIVVVNTDGTESEALNAPYRERLEQIKNQLRKEEPLKGKTTLPELHDGPRPAGDSGTTGPTPGADTPNPNPRPGLDQQTVPERAKEL